MKKNNKVFLKHILTSIKEIEDFIGSYSEEEFSKDLKTQNAVARKIEIIGGTVKNLSKDLRGKYSKVPWRELSGIRDKLIHHYFGIDMSIVWEITQQDLPVLKREIENILKDLEK